MERTNISPSEFEPSVPARVLVYLILPILLGACGPSISLIDAGPSFNAAENAENIYIGVNNVTNYVTVITEQTTRMAEAVGCPHTPNPRLVEGFFAKQTGTVNIRLRSEPGTNAPKMADIYRGDVVEILKRERCEEGFNWYYVRTSDGREGWAAEADKDGKTYWLEPLYDGNGCKLRPRLAAGSVAKNISKTTNKIRVKPAVHAEETNRYLKPAETVQIEKGPVCADGYVWYLVSNIALGINGWTAEGGHGEYWLQRKTS